ncbi:hypothetical protein [Bradyrhizobium diazoefficiens]
MLKQGLSRCHSYPLDQTPRPGNRETTRFTLRSTLAYDFEQLLFWPHYRAALEVAEDLEREHACAQRALTSTLLDVEGTLRGKAPPHLNNDLFEIGSAAVARSDNTWADLVEATARLDSARRTLAALERQLGYLPKVPRGADPK